MAIGGARRERGAQQWTVLEVERLGQLAAAKLRESCGLFGLTQRGEVERLPGRAQLVVDELERYPDAGLAREGRAQDLVSCDDPPQCSLERRCVHRSGERDQHLNAGGGTVRLGEPQLLLLRRNVKAVCDLFRHHP